MALVHDQTVAHSRETLSDMLGYEQLLRAVGQALEKQNFQSFEMTQVGDEFCIRGMLASAVKENLADRAANMPVELQFTQQDIQRLESEGQARRVDSQRTANASSLSQELRCLGAYLNQRRARLLKLTREGEKISLEYETSLGSQLKESFGANGLYDMWVRRYMQRAGRVNQ